MKLCLIIGAMKSGTTTLHDHLCMHPEICASQTKEPSFFTDPLSLSTPARYHILFPGITPKVWACEASTNYTKYPAFPGVPQRIQAMYPAARLIYILRHPVERIYSHYLHNIAQGREQRSFKDAVLGQDTHYLNVSRYYLQLSQYLEFFPPECILVLIFEDFIQHTRETLQRVFTFLNIDPNFIPPNLHEKRNITANKTMASPVLQTLQTLPFYNYVPQPCHSLMRRLFRFPVPHKSILFNPAIHKTIVERLVDDIDNLQNYIGNIIHTWRL